MTKVAAGALASATAAVAGSKMGIGGTITGAAVVSILSTVGTAFYQHSLERTKDRVRTHGLTIRQPPISARQDAVLRRHRSTEADQPTKRIAALQPIQVGAGDAATTRLYPVSPPTDQSLPPHPASAQPPSTDRAIQLGATRLSASTACAVPAPRTSDRPPTGDQTPRRATRWALLAAGAVLAFAAGMLGLTGIELVTGQAVAGGPQGSTTFGLVTHGDPGRDHRPSRPAPTGVAPAEHSPTAVPTRGSATSVPTPAAPAVTGTAQPSVGATPSRSAAPSPAPSTGASTGTTTPAQPSNPLLAPSVTP